jgi:hypothetical protein
MFELTDNGVVLDVPRIDIAVIKTTIGYILTQLQAGKEIFAYIFITCVGITVNCQLNFVHDFFVGEVPYIHPSIG